MNTKPKYYSLKRILEKNAKYNVIFGMRSNGKTYAVLDLILQIYCKTGKQGAIIRRWTEDLKPKRASTFFENHAKNGLIKKYSKGEWETVVYKTGKWYLARLNDKEEYETDITPFCFAFALGAMEHDKSNAFPDVTTVLFDEFISRESYFKDEFVMFANVLSTIIRLRQDVTIFMCGNTVNQYCPYFTEMGLNHVKEMRKGDIDVYTYGESGLTVAVEYSDMESKKESDLYFAFDNPHLKMITTGEWEIGIYPRCPISYTPSDIMTKFYIDFNGDKIAGDLVVTDNEYFIFMYPKTTEIKENEYLIYSTNFNANPLYSRNLKRPRNKLEKIIYGLVSSEKVFYATNQTGEIMRNYLNWCNG